MTPGTDDDLYARGTATLLAAWGHFARGCAGAALDVPMPPPGVDAGRLQILVTRLAGANAATASLQSTPMAERLYASVGFRDLGRILEFAPGHPDG